MKRFLLFLLALVMLLGAVSCDSNAPDKETESETEGITDAPENQIYVADLSSYTIIYSSLTCGAQTMKAIRDLQSAIKTACGTKIQMVEDFTVQATDTQAREIVVGLTNREASVEAQSRIKKTDQYSVTLEGNMLVIAGGSDEAVAAAIQAVIAKANALSQGAECFFHESMAIRKQSEYAIGDVYLNETELCNYTVVYQNDSFCKYLAEQMQESIAEQAGYSLAVMVDTRAKNNADVKQKILIGKTLFGLPADCKEDEGYYVGSKDGDVYIYGSTGGLLKSASEWISDSLKKVGSGSVTLNADNGSVEAIDTSLKVMTFNVLVESATVSQRAPHVIETIRRNDPDVLGVQEASDAWITQLESALSNDYARVGWGRNSNKKGETTSIFYKKDKFTLIEWGTKWMSDTPDTPGSKYEGSEYIRIFTYALLERKSDGERFMHINVHPEHGAEAAKVEVRKKQFTVLANFIKDNVEVPYVLTGDLNTKETTAEFTQLKTALSFENASKVAMVAKEAPTFAQIVIDFVLFSPNDFFVYQYDVDTAKVNGAASVPSDHCPVVVVFDLKKN